MDGVELKKTIDELNRKTNNATITSTVVSMLAKSNPVTAILSLITTGSKIAAFNKKKKLKNDVIKRYDEVRKEAEKYGDAFYTDNFGFDVRNDKYLKDEKGTLKNEFDSLEKVFATNYARGKGEVSVSDRLFDSVFGGPNAFNFGRSEEYDILDALKEYKASPEYDVLAADPAAVANVPLPPNQDIPIITAKSRDTGSERLFEQVRRDTAMGEAKRFESAKAQREADAARVAANSRASTTSYNPNTGNTSTYVMNPDGTRGYTGGTSADGRSWSTGKAAAKAQADRVAAREQGYEDTRTEAVSDFFSGFFGNEGGLVAKPAMKQKNKKTTQRRKGLGTRP